MRNQKLLQEIDAFLAEKGIGDYHFGILAAKNGRLVERLRKGGRLWPETEKQVRKFMRATRKAMAKKKTDVAGANLNEV